MIGIGMIFDETYRPFFEQTQAGGVYDRAFGVCHVPLIAVAAGHRPEGVDGCRFLIDAIKSDVPIWKQEVTDAGASWGRSETNIASIEASALRGMRST